MKTRYIIATLIFSMGVFYSCFGQKEHNIWYFGCEAGVSFNTQTPTALADGMICTNEGCSSICNSNGQLLFYTDGSTIYNRNHEVMQNGADLSGGWTSTQAALIVKQPEHNEKYYVFTTANEAQLPGLRYSGVDMSLDCGLGAVNDIKDSLIEPSVCEKLTAVLHENGRDYWIVTHKYGSNDFHCYLLSPSGLDPNPVITSIGQIIDFQSWTGHIKSSNSGDKIAAAFGNGPIYPLQLFDFDRSTGLLSNEISLGSLEDPDYGNYGLEFSPNDELLYVSENSGTLNDNHIYQYDLSAGTPQLINNSRTIIWTFPTTEGEPGALQLGPDGKIYLAVWSRNALSIIEHPDSLGAASSFIEDGLSLGGSTSLGGLPSRPNSLAYPYIEAFNFCFGVTTYFSVVSPAPIDSVQWDFGDPTTGADNFSYSFDSQHIFSEPGTFYIELIVYNNSIADTLQSVVEIRSRKHNQILGNDTTLCPGESLNLNVLSECGPVEWQDGTISTNYNINQAGIYSVSAVMNGCNSRDTISVDIVDLPDINLGNDTVLCIGANLNLISPEGVPYIWQGSTMDTIYYVFEPGLYYASITNENCLASDTINIDFDYCEDPSFDLPNIITPNGDGKNDVFEIFLPPGIYFVEFSVFNRWGSRVFNSRRQHIKWNGEGSSEGTYYWVLVYADIRSKQYTKSGSVVIKR